MTKNSTAMCANIDCRLFVFFLLHHQLCIKVREASMGKMLVHSCQVICSVSQDTSNKVSFVTWLYSEPNTYFIGTSEVLP